MIMPSIRPLHYSDYGLLNQITASNPDAANISSNYEYIRSTFAPLAEACSIFSKNYKLLKKNRYLKLV